MLAGKAAYTLGILPVSYEDNADNYTLKPTLMAYLEPPTEHTHTHTHTHRRCYRAEMTGIIECAGHQPGPLH